MLHFSSSSQTSPASYNANLQYPSVLRFITQIIRLNSHYKILWLRVNSKLDKMFNFSIIHTVIPTLSEIYCYQAFNISSVKMAGILEQECNHQSHISTELGKTVHHQGPYKDCFPLGGIFCSE